MTHHEAGAAGYYGLRVVPAPVAPSGYTLDIGPLRALAASSAIPAERAGPPC